MDGGTQLMPIGHNLGAFHSGDPEATGAGHIQQVRVGAEVIELAGDRYAIWVAAHRAAGNGGEAGEVHAATETGLRAEHGAEVIDDLLGRRLLARTTPAVEFAANHRLIPLALGLGNSAEQPWLFSVGLFDQPLVQMTGALYDLWQWAHLSPDLWWACRESAAVAAQAGITEPEQTDPDQVLAGALDALPPLLAAGVACFDVRIEGSSS